MNPKIMKLRDERERNVSKIASLQTRNKKIDADIVAIENTDIVGMVREYGLSPDALFDLIKRTRKAPASIQMSEPKPKETEEMDNE